MASIVPAERLFQDYKVNSLKGRARDYDWKTWFDGQCREFVYGEDFDDISAAHFISTARKAAKARGLQLETKVDSPTVCVFRAYRPGT